MDALLKIVKESGIWFSGTLAARALSYVLLMLLTRLLAPAEYGTFALAQSIISIAMVVVLLGSHRTLDRFVPFYNAGGEEGKTKTLVRSVMGIIFPLSIVVGLILLVASEPLCHSILKKPGLLPVFRVMLLTLPALAVSELVSSTFIGFKELRYPVYTQQLAPPSLMMLLAIVALAGHHSLLDWTWMYSGSLLGCALFAVWLFRRHVSPRFSGVSGSRISLREIFSYSWPLSVSSITVIVLGQVGVLFLGYFRPSAEIGIYRVYVALAALIRLMPQAIVPIFKPVISEMISTGRVEEVRETYGRITKWIFLATALGFLVLLMFGAEIVPLVFTEHYLAVPAALLVLTAGNFVDCAFGPKATALMAFARTRLFMANSLISLGASAGLCILLVPQYGILGAAVANAGGMVLGGFAGFLQIHLLYGVQPYNSGYLKYISVALAAAGATYVARLWGDLGGIGGLVVSILLLTALYVAGLFVSRSFDLVDLEILGHVRAKIAGQRET